MFMVVGIKKPSCLGYVWGLYYTVFLGMVSNMFLYLPRSKMENDPIFDEHIFQLGCGNHQLVMNRGQQMSP